MRVSENKKFFAKLLLFLIPLIVSFAVVETGLNSIPNSYTLKKNLLEKNRDTLKVIILGSSHEFWGINPEKWGVPSLNLANTSQSIWYDLKILEKALQKSSSVKVVIMPISYISLEYDLTGNYLENWRKYYYFRFWGITYRDFSILDPKNYSLFALYTPEKALNYIKKGFRINLAENISGNGWTGDGRKTGISKIKQTGKARAQTHLNMMDKKYISQNISSLEKIADLCAENKISLYLVTLPTHDSYSENIPAATIKGMYNQIADFAGKNKIAYFDYSGKKDFQADDYVDTDHLNIKGSEKLSLMIYKDIIMKEFKLK